MKFCVKLKDSLSESEDNEDEYHVTAQYIHEILL